MTHNRLFDEELQAFAKRISDFLNELGIAARVRGLVLDHVCLRQGEEADVEVMREWLSRRGKEASSAIVNGREILIFEMDEPIRIGDWAVPCIELPYPKSDHGYPDGWEHAEFVIPSEETTLVGFCTDFSGFFPGLDIEELRREGILSESEPESESDQLPNPTVTLRKDTRTAVKFHPCPIAEIVRGTRN